jgi:hypothetical protein
MINISRSFGDARGLPAVGTFKFHLGLDNYYLPLFANNDYLLAERKLSRLLSSNNKLLKSSFI